MSGSIVVLGFLSLGSQASRVFLDLWDSVFNPSNPTRFCFYTSHNVTSLPVPCLLWPGYGYLSRCSSFCTPPYDPNSSLSFTMYIFFYLPILYPFSLPLFLFLFPGSWRICLHCMCINTASPRRHTYPSSLHSVFPYSPLPRRLCPYSYFPLCTITLILYFGPGVCSAAR